MKVTQKIQPEIKRIQEEFKDQPEKLQQEILRVWRENKANPLGGCLPLLIQLPFFFGIFQTINGPAFKAILAQPGINPGMFPIWLTNLAAPDPWFILPAVPTARKSDPPRTMPKIPSAIPSRIAALLITVNRRSFIRMHQRHSLPTSHASLDQLHQALVLPMMQFPLQMDQHRQVNLCLCAKYQHR